MEDLICKYLTKFPDIPTLTLAKLLIKEHPKAFLSVEACRSAIRYRRGNIGERCRKNTAKTKKSTFRPNGTAGFKFEMPESIASPSKDFYMPEGDTLVMADIHIPYHDKRALQVAVDHGRRKKVNNILIAGDGMDFFSISRWDKNPEERNLPKELELCRHFVAYLRERFPEARIIYKIGNHEERWEHYLWAKAPELCGCAFTTFQSIMDFDRWGIETVNGKQKVKFGKHLTAIHGHEIPNGSTPVNFARTLQSKLGVCAIGGHRHTTSEHSHKNADGKYVTCWGLGCLCDMSPDYAIINSWNHGVAIVRLKNDDFEVKNSRIIDWKVR